MYKPGCRISNLEKSWGHDEYRPSKRSQLGSINNLTVIVLMPGACLNATSSTPSFNCLPILLKWAAHHSVNRVLQLNRFYGDRHLS
mmetsp:Transcript_28552/g.51906  ORF Transcript_28552/g.51906 Transcript_28552/m.51906 type:complete len:86 (+) Transcript_28552:97-354(+)